MVGHIEKERMSDGDSSWEGGRVKCITSSP